MRNVIFLSAIVLIFSTGCHRSDGDRLARVGRKVAEKVEALVPERTPFHATIGASKNEGPVERVKSRFKSDRFLAPTAIDVAAEGNTIHLKGRVDDDVLKQRAVEIAETTVGVDNVIVEIDVRK